MLHEVATDNVLTKLTINAGQGHWTIILGVCLVSFLVKMVYIGMFPAWERLLVEGCLEK